MNTPQKPAQWYQEHIEQLLRAGVDRRKRKMIEVLEQERVVTSFNQMHSFVKGRRENALLAWQELKHSGEIVECRFGWCLARMGKYVVDKAADGFMTSRLNSKAGWGAYFREKWLKENKPEFKAAREAMEARQRANDPIEAKIAEARRLLAMHRTRINPPAAPPTEPHK